MDKVNEKSIDEFNNVEEILEFLKNLDNIKIKVSREIKYSGFYQLADDKKEKLGYTLDKVKEWTMDKGTDIGPESWVSDEEDFDLYKPLYEDYIFEKENGFTSKSNLIKLLNEFNDDDDYEELESVWELDDFLKERNSDLMEYLEVSELNFGYFDNKDKEISWWGNYWTEDEELEIVFIT